MDVQVIHPLQASRMSGSALSDHASLVLPSPSSSQVVDERGNRKFLSYPNSPSSSNPTLADVLAGVGQFNQLFQS